MAHIDIEYRYSGKPLDAPHIRRKTVQEMEDYLRALVLEMQTGGIKATYVAGFAVDGESNMVFINGRAITEILEGLAIKSLPEEGGCGLDSGPKPLVIKRPETEWDRIHVEDLSDTMIKNAVSKAYSGMPK